MHLKIACTRVFWACVYSESCTLSGSSRSAEVSLDLFFYWNAKWTLSPRKALAHLPALIFRSAFSVCCSCVCSYFCTQKFLLHFYLHINYSVAPYPGCAHISIRDCICCYLRLHEPFFNCSQWSFLCSHSVSYSILKLQAFMHMLYSIKDAMKSMWTIYTKQFYMFAVVFKWLHMPLLVTYLFGNAFTTLFFMATTFHCCYVLCQYILIASK